jgi:hypothetical protein
MSETGTALVERIVREAIRSEIGKDRGHIEALESRLEQVESQLVLQVSLLLQIVEAIKNNKPTPDEPDYLEFLRKSTVPASPHVAWPATWGPSSSAVVSVPAKSLRGMLPVGAGDKLYGRTIDAIELDLPRDEYLIKFKEP